VKKIICNNKLKKICTTLILFMLLFNFVFPNFIFPSFVFAESNDAYKFVKWEIADEKYLFNDVYIYKGSLRGIVSSTNTKTSKESQYYPTIYDRTQWSIKSAVQVQNFENKVKTAISKFINDGNYPNKDELLKDNNIDKIYNYNQDNIKLSVKVKFKGTGYELISGQNVAVELWESEIYNIDLEKIDIENAIKSTTQIEDVDYRRI